jgi:hypothetical protein
MGAWMRDYIESKNNEPKLAPSRAAIQDIEFRRGARMMFDALLYRVANNWNPSCQEACDRDNKWAIEWASNALKEVSPDDYTEWKTINTAWEEGHAVGKSSVLGQIPKGRIARILWAIFSSMEGKNEFKQETNREAKATRAY